MTHLQAVLSRCTYAQTQLDNATETRDGWLDQRRYVIRRAYELGATQAEIAAATGLTRQRVAKILERNGR